MDQPRESQPAKPPVSQPSEPSPEAQPAGTTWRNLAYWTYLVGVLFSGIAVYRLDPGNILSSFWQHLFYLEQGEFLFSLFIGIPVLAWSATLVHELGHALTAQLLGLKVWRVRVGPVIFEPLKRGLRVRYSWVTKQGGAAYFYSDDPEHPRLRSQHALAVLVGLLASLFLLVAAFATYLSLGLAFYSSEDLFLWELYAAPSLVVIGTVAAWHFMLCIYPMAYGYYQSDGLQLLKLRRPTFTDELRRDYRYAWLHFGPIRPKDWDMSMFDQPDLEESFIGPLYRLTLRYYHAVEHGDSQSAKTALAQALDAARASAPELVPLLHFEAAYLYAFHLGDYETAQAHFDDGAVLSGDKGEQFRARVALLLAEQKYPEALKQADRALAYLRKERDTGVKQMEMAWLLAMREQAVSRHRARESAVAVQRGV